MTPPASPRRRKLRMLRAGEVPEDTTLLIRATPASLDEAVLDIVETALDSAEAYEVERPSGGRVVLYGVSVFARPSGISARELLRRFAASPFYLEASVGDLRVAGFAVLPTGANADHFEVLLVDGHSPDQPLLAPAALEARARRLVEVCGEMRPIRRTLEASMTDRRANPRYVHEVDLEIVQRLSAAVVPHPRAVEMGVDIVGDPHREDDDGYNWTRLRYARNVADVTPGSVVVMGSRVGSYLAKVVAWDFEVSDDDPIVTLDLLPVTPDAVQRALARRHTSAA